MSEAKKQPKAGMGVRFLDIPVTNQQHGCFDDLHGYPTGRAFADAIKKESARHYGHAGREYVARLIADSRDFPGEYAATRDLPQFVTRDEIEGRAASTFALIGMAGELATEYGIVDWPEGKALNTSIWAFQAWKFFRGEGQTETRQILQGITDFLSAHGDSRFSELGSQHGIINRAGYWRKSGDEVQYLFHAAGLREAAQGFDFNRVLDALEDQGWIAEAAPSKRSKQFKINGRVTALYVITPKAGATYES